MCYRQAVNSLLGKTLRISYPSPASVLGVYAAALLFLQTAQPFDSYLVSHIPINFLSSPAEIRSAWGLSDPGSYLQMALELRAGEPRSGWIFNLWPPGMPALYLIGLLLYDMISLPFLVFLSVVQAALFGVLVRSVFKKMHLNWPETLPWAVGVTGFSLSDQFSFLAVYFAYADGIALFFVLLGILGFWPQVDRRDSFPRLVGSAGMIAAASYLRSIYEIFSTILLIVLVAMWIVRRMSLSWRTRGVKPRLKIALSRGLVVFFLVQLFMAPWRLIAGTLIRPADFRWTTVADNSWAVKWAPTEFLLSRNAEFMVEGSGNFACTADPERCQMIALTEVFRDTPYEPWGDGYSAAQFRDLFLTSFFERPNVYIYERFHTLFRGMFSSTDSPVGVFEIPSVTILLLVSALAALRIRRLVSAAPEVSALLLTLLSVVIAVQTLFHAEPRYFLPAELVLALISILSFSRVLPRSPHTNARGGEPI